MIKVRKTNTDSLDFIPNYMKPLCKNCGQRFLNHYGCFNAPTPRYARCPGVDAKPITFYRPKGRK